MVLLETNRLRLQTIDIPLLDAASKQDHQAIKELGYETNGEWPNSDFLKRYLISARFQSKTMEQKDLIHGLL